MNANEASILDEAFDRPISFHRVFVTITGSVTAALFLSQSWYWSKRTKDPEGWFYKTREEWEEETGMSRYEQEGARSRLKELNILEEKSGGMPKRLFYRINRDRVLELIANLKKCDDNLKKSESNLKKSESPQLGEKPPTSWGENHQHVGYFSTDINNESEITTETTHWAQTSFARCDAETNSSLLENTNDVVEKENHQERPKVFWNENWGIDWAIAHGGDVVSEVVLANTTKAKRNRFIDHLRNAKPHLVPLAEEFIDLTNFVPERSDYGLWIKGLQYLYDTGARRRAVNIAISMAQKQNLTLSAPHSLRNLIRTAIKKSIPERY